MKTIPLTQNRVALVDDSDYESLGRHKWLVTKQGKYEKRYYAKRCIRVPGSGKQFIHMHRVILNAPEGVDVDHINGDSLDNRRSNLRLCTRRENARHQRLRSDNTVGFKGVVLDRRNLKKPYRVRIKLNDKYLHVGYYETSDLAAQAYDFAAMKHFSEFALTNERLGLL